MPIIPSTTWALLSLLCVCLVFGNGDVNAESEKKQLRREVRDVEPPKHAEEPLLPGDLSDLLYGKKGNSKLPVVTISGVLYYDLSEVNDEELDIKKNNQSVEGVTASQRECKVQSLRLRTTYLLDEDLFTNCPLRNLTLKDDKWQCLKIRRMLEQQNVTVDMRSAKCLDTWDDRKLPSKYYMKEGFQKLDEFNITGCSAERCVCRYYFKEHNYTVTVDCEGLGLTDDTLPTLPSQVNTLRLEKNFLHSIDKLMQHLMPQNQTLNNVLVDDNQIQELPRLAKGTFPNISVISLTNNKIEKIDIDVFEDLIARKDFDVLLQGNPFRCNCDMYSFKNFLVQRCMKGSRICTRTYIGLKCQHEHENKSVPVYEMSGDDCTGFDWSQVDWWLVLNISLGVANLFVIYLMIDLICIHTKFGGKKDRRPMMDRVVCALKRVMCCFYWRSEEVYKEN